ncbi:MAG: Ig-like domain-containing protein, partial [Bacilli bacterium]
GQTVELKFNVRAIPGSFSNSNYIESDVSENSRVFNYTNSSLIKMETPTNVSIDDNYNATWTASTGAEYYWITFEINGKSETLYGQMITTNYSSEYSYGTVTGNVFGANIEKAVADFYSDMVRTKQIQSGQTVELKFNVRAIPGSFSDKNYIESEYSIFSSKFYYNSDGSTKIDLITLSPNQPVVAIGKFLYIGKTIIPEKAYYSRIEWSSNNNAVVSIDSMGKITGIKKGKANINAKINNATQSALVSVYEINSNFKNESSSEKVLDAATGIINSIIIDENTKNTDIRNVKEAINEIENGAQNGNEFKVELNNTKKNKESFDSVESQIKGLHSDMNIAGGYDIRVGISHEDKEGIKHHIGNITEFKDKITFDIDLLSNMPVLANTKTREYQLVRYHEGQLVDVETTNNSNGTISATSNKFSDFVLLYKDINIPVSGILVNETDLLLDIGSTEIVNVTINPSNAENKRYSSISNDATIATINGNSITAVGIGTTKITFTTEDGRYSKEIRITVKSPLKSISLNKTSGIVNVGEKESLTVIYNPINTTDNKTISWTTSNNAIVTVNNGIVTAVGVGNAIITARVGSKSATCNIIVKSPLKSISLNKTSGIINVGAKETLTVIYNPSNTTDSKEVTWQSDNSAIATVSNGIVVGLKEGSTTITAKVGNLTATYQVNVYDMRLNDIVKNLNYKLTDKFIHGFVLNETFNNIKLKFGTDVIINSRTSIIGTGTQISYRGETIIAVIYGDISGDGLINSADLLKMRQHLLGTNLLIGEYRQAASLVNGNLINSADLLRLRQYLLGINTINQ